MLVPLRPCRQRAGRARRAGILNFRLVCQRFRHLRRIDGIVRRLANKRQRKKRAANLYAAIPYRPLRIYHSRHHIIDRAESFRFVRMCRLLRVAGHLNLETARRIFGLVIVFADMRIHFDTAACIRISHLPRGPILDIIRRLLDVKITHVLAAKSRSLVATHPEIPIFLELRVFVHRHGNRIDIDIAAPVAIVFSRKFSAKLVAILLAIIEPQFFLNLVGGHIFHSPVRVRAEPIPTNHMLRR